MSEIINSNVFDANKKFVDFAGLDYFWDKAKAYIDGIDTTIKGSVKAVEDRATALETTVGNADSGIVKEVNALRAEVNALGGANGGSISDMIDGKINNLGAAGVAEGDDFVKSVSVVNGKLQVTSGKCKDWSGDIADAQAAAQSYADGLAKNYDEAGAADATLEAAKGDATTKANAAEAAAKSYADGLASNYDAAGAAAAAETAAKSHADGLNTAMDTRVKVLEAIDHEKLATDASAAAVATILDGAPEKFDTLKEVADWIASSETADSAADLVTRVAALEAIDHDAYVEADKTVLQGAKDYADGLAKNYDAAGSAAAAEAAAKAYADSLAGNYDAKGDAAAAQAAAIAEATRLDGVLETNVKAYADGLVKDEQGKSRFDATGSAAQALVDAKAYADGLAGNYDAAGTAASAASTAKSEAIAEATRLDGVLKTEVQSYADGVASTAKSEAIAQAKADATEALKAYYTKTEIDAKLAENSTGDREYAKTYTDQLFNSFKFASTGDIDGLFN